MKDKKTIKVLIVDDSPSAQQLLNEILSSDPEIQVVGIADSGDRAIEMLKIITPDVITMDIYMQGMDGFQATGKILESTPVPIVIISACYGSEDAEKAFRAIEMGAVAILSKPGITDIPNGRNAQEIIKTVKLMSEVRVITRRAGFMKKEEPDPAMHLREPGQAGEKIERKNDIRIIAIGASTGGPQTIHPILSMLPSGLRVPILIVQHIAPGFLQGMIDWLKQSSGLHMCIAEHNTVMQPGHVYFAPDGVQMGVDVRERIVLSGKTDGDKFIPSISYLFGSIANFMGKNAIGVLLTGMGKDGAAGLKLMKDRGSITIAQDRESAIIDSMPGEAIRIGGATYVMPPEKIADMLIRLVGSP